MIDYDNKIVGRQIKYYREKNNLSQKELAKMIGISASFLGDLEKGGKTDNSSVSMKNICKIAEVLNISIDLLVGENIEFPKGNNVDTLLNVMENELDSLTSENLDLFYKITTILADKNKKL